MNIILLFLILANIVIPIWLKKEYTIGLLKLLRNNITKYEMKCLREHETTCSKHFVIIADSISSVSFKVIEEEVSLVKSGSALEKKEILDDFGLQQVSRRITDQIREVCSEWEASGGKKYFGLSESEWNAFMLLYSFDILKKNAIKFYNDLKNPDNTFWFCGNQFGISGFKYAEKNKELILNIYKTNYHTYRIFQMEFEKKENQKLFYKLFDCISFYKNNQKMQNLIFGVLRYHFSAIGLNCVISGNAFSSRKHGYLLGKRSKNVTETYGYDRWHVPMNETLSYTDMCQDNKQVRFDNWLYRGIQEEIGFDFNDDSINIEELGSHASIMDFFLYKDYGQLGISSVLDMGNYNLDRLNYLLAQDKILECADLQFIPWNNKNRYQAFLYINDEISEKYRYFPYNEDLIFEQFVHKKSNSWTPYVPFIYERMFMRKNSLFISMYL